MLLTKENRKSLPVLYATEKVKLDDKKLVVKFFTPDNGWTWYATEFDGEDIFFGLVVSPICPEGEWGNFSLSELKKARGPLGLPIERDMYWKPIAYKLLKK